MSIQDLRRKIDEIDANIVRLLGERVKVAEELGKHKRENDQQIEDRGREAQVVDRVKILARQAGVDTDEIENIYLLIIRACKGIQGIQVAFQGELGAYSEQAARAHFGQAVEVKPCESFEDVFKSVQNKSALYGVVPVENSLEGSVNRVYDLLLDSDLKVCGEIETKVSHCLIVHPGVTLDSIKKVYSHPQALGQCQNFLKHLGCEIVPTYDTAGSVKIIKDQEILDGAAIASARAAEIYGMKIIAREIEDNPGNTTRFMILTTHSSRPTGSDKTSIVFSLKHQPGTLYEALRLFAERKINLTKIESRPTKRKPWEYNFYLDFEGHREEPVIAEAIVDLEKSCSFLKVLGSYPKARS